MAAYCKGYHFISSFDRTIWFSIGILALVVESEVNQFRDQRHDGQKDADADDDEHTTYDASLQAYARNDSRNKSSKRKNKESIPIF